MAQYIDKTAIASEIKRRIVLLENNSDGIISMLASGMFVDEYKNLLSFLETLKVKEEGETMSIAYVVTRCEEHSDYVEKVFFDEDKAHKYCDQFKGNENEYARHITRVDIITNKIQKGE